MALSWYVPHSIIRTFFPLREWLLTASTCLQVNFAPQFVAAEGNATVQAVADHVEHIGAVAGRKQYIFRSVGLYCIAYPFFSVGIGSDFDGIGSVPRGLEDVSKYPDLVGLTGRFLPVNLNYHCIVC